MTCLVAYIYFCNMFCFFFAARFHFFLDFAESWYWSVSLFDCLHHKLTFYIFLGKGPNARLRLKNYASPDCGAKVVAANPEATHAHAILYNSEEYKLNPCTSRIWFVVELCEGIQPKRIEIANYELYSSSLKDFTLAVSDRYPSRDWTYIGKFTGKDEKTIQSFDVDTEIFGKYVKVEIKSHYGSEHYCPISLFRVYGTSVFEVLQVFAISIYLFKLSWSPNIRSGRNSVQLTQFFHKQQMFNLSQKDCNYHISF